MLLVYIAGPYTAKTACGVAENIQRARSVADLVNRIGDGRCFAVVPHFLGSGIEDSGTPQFWYDGTMEVLRRCDAVVVCCPPYESGSKGTIAECNEAQRIGLPVFGTPSYISGTLVNDEFSEWLRGKTVKK